MPPKKKVENTEVRKSARSQPREKKSLLPEKKKPKQKFSDLQAGEGPLRKKGRPAKRTLEPQRESVDQAEVPEKRPAVKETEGYCWICHGEWPKDDADERCTECTRVFHKACLGQNHGFSKDRKPCLECLAKRVDGTNTISRIPIKDLSRLLLMVHRKLAKLSPEFETWTTPRFVNSSIIAMDFHIIEDKLNSAIFGFYSTTAQFYSDIKQISHNCHIIYGSNNILTSKSKLLVKHCKDELIDLEACWECFTRALYNKNNIFTQLCSVRHHLVWAKMKGFPYWPAKVLKVIDGVANVWFFGTHDKTKIAITNCLWMSEQSPNKKVRSKKDYELSLAEMRKYTENMVEKFGKYQYSNPGIPYDPGAMNYSTKPSSKPSTKGKKAGRPSKGKNTTAAAGTVPNNDVPSTSTSLPSTSTSLPSTSTSLPSTSTSLPSTSTSVPVSEAVPISEVTRTAADDRNDEFIGAYIQAQYSLNNEEIIIDDTDDEEDEVEVIPPSHPPISNYPVQIQEHILYDANDYTAAPVECNPLNSDYYLDFNVEDQVSVDYHAPGIIEKPRTLTDDDVVSDIVSQVCDNVASELNSDCAVIISNAGIVDDITNIGSSAPRYSFCELNDRSNNNMNESMPIMVNGYCSIQTDHQAGAFNRACFQADMDKVMNKTRASFECHLQNWYEDVSRTFDMHEGMEVRRELEKKIEELESDKNDLLQTKKEITSNADLVIAKITRNLEEERQNLITANENHKKEVADKIAETRLELEIRFGNEIAHWKSTLEAKNKQSLLEKKQAVLEATSGKKSDQASVEIRLKKAVWEERKKCIAKMKKEVAETKKHTWCKICQKKAEFFCCINASYCSENCRDEHWSDHKEECKAISNGKRKTQHTSITKNSHKDICPAVKQTPKSNGIQNGNKDHLEPKPSSLPSKRLKDAAQGRRKKVASPFILHNTVVSKPKESSASSSATKVSTENGINGKAAESIAVNGIQAAAKM